MRTYIVYLYVEVKDDFEGEVADAVCDLLGPGDFYLDTDHTLRVVDAQSSAVEVVDTEDGWVAK